MKITKYPQSCCLIEYKGKTILNDPGKYLYAMTEEKPEDFRNINLILFTHDHGDHIDVDPTKIIWEINNRMGSK